jgi:hypothetical protein
LLQRKKVLLSPATKLPCDNIIIEITVLRFKYSIQAISYGCVYVLYFPEYDGLPTRQEHASSTRHIIKAVSPITVFVSKPSSTKGKPNELIPVAIQMGHTPGKYNAGQPLVLICLFTDLF